MNVKALMFSMLLAQAQQAQLQAPPPKASIEGTIVRIGTAEPVVGARVILSKVATPPAPGAVPAAPTLPGLPGAPGTIPPVSTDDRGRFLFKDVDAGSYRLVAIANAYARVEYGQRVLGSQGTPINLAVGQVLKDVALRMTPAGNVTGRITTDTGQPAVGAQVQLSRATYNAAGQRTLQSVGQGTTNDRGEYRIFWVTPGRYYLNVGSAARPILSPEAGVLGSQNGIQENFTSTFYPGAADMKDASAIEVQPGVELSAIDLRVARQQLHRIRGRVIDGRTGQYPATVLLSFTNRGPTGTGGVTQNMSTNYVAADGTFELRDIGSGTYGLAAQIPDTTDRTPSIFPGGSTGPTAKAAVTVLDSDVEGIVLTVVPGATLPGRMAVEGAELAAIPGFDRVRVQLTAPINTAFGFIQSPQAQPISPDGTFREDNVTPGQFRIAVAPLPPNFYLKEARFDQTDVLNSPMQFSGTIPTPLDVVISAKAAEINGTLVDDKGQPVTSATQVVLIPDQHRDRVDLYKTSLTDARGHFVIRGVAPGAYKLFAWEAIEQFAYFDADLVRRFEPQGKAINVAESEKPIVEVKLIPAP